VQLRRILEERAALDASDDAGLRQLAHLPGHDFADGAYGVGEVLMPCGHDQTFRLPLGEVEEMPCDPCANRQEDVRGEDLVGR
jgi:hypothetical protein